MLNKLCFVAGFIVFCIAFMGLEADSFDCLQAMALGAVGTLAMAGSAMSTGWFD